EALLARRLGEALVERYEFERSRTALGRDKGGCKLQRIGGPQRVNPKKSHRAFAHDLTRLNFVPGIGEPAQAFRGNGDCFRVEGSGAFEACQSRHALHLRAPPHQHLGITPCERLHTARHRFQNQQRHDGRRIPKLHRPSRRSSISTSRIEAGGSARGGWLLKIARAGALRRGRTRPSRRSRASLASCSPAWAPVTVSRRATGRPRSTVSTGEPPFRLSIKALRLFFASVMLTLFIGLE